MNVAQYRATSGKREPRSNDDRWTRRTPPANPVLSRDTAAALKAMLASAKR